MATTKKKVAETNDEILREELERQIREEEKLKKKAVTDQVLRFLGLILASIIFLISFSMMAGLTIFAGLFDLSARQIWRENLSFVFQDGSIYYAFIGPDPTVAILLMSVIQISLAFLLAFLISYYIRDLIGIVKEIFNLGKNITDELGTNIKEGVQEIVGNGEKKSLFGDSGVFKKSTTTKKSKVERELEKIKREAEKSNLEIEVPSTVPADVEEDDLDKALTDPNYKPQAQEAQPEPKKSLFDSK